MAVTYFSVAKKLFDGAASAGVAGQWLRIPEAKQLRVWAKASVATTIKFKLSIFPPGDSQPNRDTDFILTGSYNVTTSWTELVVPELDGPLDSVAVVPDATVADLKVYVAGSAV